MDHMKRRSNHRVSANHSKTRMTEKIRKMNREDPRNYMMLHFGFWEPSVKIGGVIDNGRSGVRSSTTSDYDY